MRHKVLFISHGSPLVPNSGYAYRAYGILCWLAQRYDVDVIFQGTKKDQHSINTDGINLSSIEVVEHHTTITDYLRAVFGIRPFHNALASNPSMGRSISSAMSRNKYAFIWTNKTWHLDLLKESKVPIIMDQIAEDLSVWGNLVENDPRRWAVPFFKLNHARVQRTYGMYYSQLSGVVCISSGDRDRTASFRPKDNIIHIPVGYFESKYKAALSPTGSKCLLFSGTDAMRNQQAVRLFCEKVLPSLRNSMPGVTLLWIGNVNRKKLCFTPPPEVLFTGYVDDVKPYFSRGDIYVAPFDMGEGVKIKIIEAMAMGKVIVGTSVGVRGVGIEGQPFIRVCDDWRDFSSAVVDLAKDPNLPALCAESAKYAQSHLSWDKVLSPLEPFIRYIILKSGRGE